MNEKTNFTGEPRFPRFKQGDRVVYMLNSEPKFCGTVTQVNEHQGTTESNHYYTYHIRFDHGMDAKWVNEFWLMPCEDPKPEKLCKSEHSSEQFDKILAKDLRKEKRLRIATQLMAAMMSNPVMFNKSIPVEYEDIVHGSLEYADALIEAVEKGGCQ